VPIYAYRCAKCGQVTDAYEKVSTAPKTLRCSHCGAKRAKRIISRVAYHASEATKTSRLDPKYEKMADDAAKKSASADPMRLLKKMKPFAGAMD
jgi:putative FmdB family regulatory protein